MHWDLRYQPIAAGPAVQGGGGGGGGGGGQGGNMGPFVMPGDYRVTLLVGDKEVATKPVRVIGDVAIPMTDADRRTLHDTTLALHRLHASANEAATAVTELSTQFQTLEGLAQVRGGTPARGEDGHRRRRQAVSRSAPQARRGRARCAAGRWWWWRGGGGGGGQQQNVRSSIVAVKGQLTGVHSPPTAQQVRGLTDGRADMARVITDTNALITKVPALLRPDRRRPI